MLYCLSKEDEMKLYKLTDSMGKTYGHTQWGEGVTHKAKRGKGELCSDKYIHAYTHPLLAVFLNPIHADFKDPQLWEAEGHVAQNDRGLKVGCKSLTTIREMDLPTVTKEQRVRFAILCALEVCKEEGFRKWADGWLSGEDRSESAAYATVHAVSAAVSAGRYAVWSAGYAGYAARSSGCGERLIAIAEEAVKEGTK